MILVDLLDDENCDLVVREALRKFDAYLFLLPGLSLSILTS